MKFGIRWPEDSVELTLRKQESHCIQFSCVVLGVLSCIHTTTLVTSLHSAKEKSRCWGMDTVFLYHGSTRQSSGRTLTPPCAFMATSMGSHGSYMAVQ